VPEFNAFGDLDGDGIEDVAIAARCKNPMVDQRAQLHGGRSLLRFFWVWRSKLTTTFSEPDPKLRGLVVLIIDGADKGAAIGHSESQVRNREFAV